MVAFHLRFFVVFQMHFFYKSLRTMMLCTCGLVGSDKNARLLQECTCRLLSKIMFDKWKSMFGNQALHPSYNHVLT